MRHALALCSVLVTTALVSAQEHYREIVALRWWGGEAVSVETFWGLTVGIGEGSDAVVPGVDAIFGFHEGEPDAITVDRFPNNDEVDVFDARQRVARTDNAVWLEHFEDGFVLATCHGVRMLIGSPLDPPVTLEQIGGSLDAALLVLSEDDRSLDRAKSLLSALRPGTIALAGHGPTVEALVESVPPIYEVERAPGNTVAVATPHPLESRVPRVVVLKDSPWEPEGELAELYEAKELGAKLAGLEFGALTVEQMNHLPSDGTHRPRWNIEHMAGQEITLYLNFFARKDSAFRREDPRPANNKPAEYEMKHPEWSAAEEVREIERTQRFVRRFGYLLDGVELDARPEGGGWSLRTVFERMAWHWGHHTGKLGSKMELEDWPSGD